MVKSKNGRAGLGGKQPLGFEISTRLKAKNGGIKQAAERLRLNYQRLRQDLSESRFARSDLLKLCAAVELDSDLAALRLQYEFSLRKGPRGLGKRKRMWENGTGLAPGENELTLPMVFSYYDLRQEKISRIQEAAKDDIPNLFRGLRKGDSLFLTITNELPLHWLGQEGANTLPYVAEAIEKGVLLCYLRPGEQFYSQLSKVPIIKFQSPVEIQEKFEEFKRLLEQYINPVTVHEQTTCIDFPWPVCTPHTRYALYHHVPAKGQPMSWATVTVPWKSGWKNVENESGFAIFEVNDSLRDFLLDFCRHAVANARRPENLTATPNPALEKLHRQLFWRPSATPTPKA